MQTPKQSQALGTNWDHFSPHPWNGGAASGERASDHTHQYGKCPRRKNQKVGNVGFRAWTATTTATATGASHVVDGYARATRGYSEI